MANYYITMTKSFHNFELNFCSPQNAYRFKSLAQCFKAAYASNGSWKGMSLIV